MSSFQAYSRSMDELTYQLNLSDTLDWSYDEEDETNSTIANLEGNESNGMGVSSFLSTHD